MVAARQPASATTALSLDVVGVSHSFALDGRSLPVLDRVDLALAAGEFVAILGPSGCGKSTLLRLVAGLEPPVQGTLSAAGVPHHRAAPVARADVPGPDAVPVAHRAGQCRAGP